MQKMMNKRKGLIWLAIILMGVFSAFAFYNFQNKAQAAAESTIYFNPADTSVNLNQDFNLEAKINPASNQITAVVVDMTFDHTKFSLTSITPSSSFSSVLQPAAIDNNAGTGSITLGVPLHNPPTPVTSDSVVATFVFHSLTSPVSSAPFTFTSQSMAAALNETSDVIVTRTPATVTISAKTYSMPDFVNLVADWLKTASSPADVNSDGKVNSRDLGIMMHSWVP